MIDFRTDPGHYRHWKLSATSAVAELAMAVDPSATMFDGYELKINSYDCGVDIELHDAIQAVSCIGMRACHTNTCPVGIATQKPHLRARLPVDIAAERLARFFSAAVDLMTVLPRAAGHSHLNEFSADDLTTFKTDMANLTGLAYGGVG